MVVKKYKGRFYAKLPDGSFLSITIWPGKSNPDSEVIVTEIRRNQGDIWETITRLAIFRTPEGKYIHLPEKERYNSKKEKLRKI